MKQAPKELIKEIELNAKERKAKILNAKSEYPLDAKRYIYVDADCGDDSNDGLSEKTALKSIERLAAFELFDGDVVLFKRGCVWRTTQYRMAQNVTYSAYGEGEKPKFYGSVDASNPDDWCPTKYKNIWKFRPMIAYVKDVGAIIFNDGECWGVKVCKNFVNNTRCDMYDGGVAELVSNGRKTFRRYREEIKDYSIVKNDLEFYHDYSDEHVYLYCEEGNPAKVFKSIEMSLRVSLFIGGRNVTLDNLCFKYTGIHAVGHSGQNVLFKNCEFGFIGGSNQFTEHQMMGLKAPFRDDATRLGNGLEVYGGCNNYTIRDCYFYQIYDAAMTAQYMSGHSDKDVVMHDINWYDNLIDTSNYPFELWLAVQNVGEGVKIEMRNVQIYNNICLNTGYGWGTQRGDPSYTFFYFDPQKTLCQFINTSCHDNYLVGGKGKVTVGRMTGTGNGIQFEHNTILHNGPLAIVREFPETPESKLIHIENSDEGLAFLTDNGYWKDCDVYNIDDDTTNLVPYMNI